MHSERCDALIVVALQQDLDAVLGQGVDGRAAWTEARDSTGATYFRRTEVNVRGEEVRFAAAWLGAFGQMAATMRSRRLIDELDPACIVSSGLCAGNRSRVHRGDVIVAERVVSLEASNSPTASHEDEADSVLAVVSDLDLAWRTNAAVLANDTTFRERVEAARPPSIEAQVDWLRLALLEQRENGAAPPAERADRKRRCPDWSAAMQRLVASGDAELNHHGVPGLTEKGRLGIIRQRALHPDGLPGDPPWQAHLGSIGTVSAVVRTFGIFDAPASHTKELYGVDMESSAIVSVAHHLGRRWLVVRGVSDFADATKADGPRDFAAWAAASYAYSFLLRYLDVGSRETPSSDRLPERLQLSVEEIEITGFKNIERLSLNLMPTSKLPGRWTCLAGINGSGKTSILQAIALVLLGEKLTEQLGSIRLARMVRRSEELRDHAEITASVRAGAEVTRLSLPLSGDGIDSARLDANPGVKEMRALWERRARRGILASYGASRNLSEYVDNRHEALHLEVQRQMTLFDPLSRVARAELLFSHGARLTPVLTTLGRVLAILFRDLPLSMANSEEALRFVISGSEFHPSALPDGFRSTIAWLGDLCALWHEKATSEEIGDGDPSNIHGIVLVDEIDLHLHPSLQRVLVPRLREALPRVQWIVTTHSPLVLASFDRSEIRMLDSSEPNGVRELDRDILGFSMDQIYDWLMETPPRGVVLEEMLARAGEADLAPERRRELAALVASAPDFNAEQAEQRVAWRSELLERIRLRPALEAPPAPVSGSKGE